jgi:hypothetical protein
VLNASGHLKCSSLAKNALFRLREYSTGLDFEVLEDDSVSIRALLN